MENASKALIMAASMLIGILILSLMIYLFASFANTASKTYEQKQEEQLEQFNTQFTSYVGDERITIYDVITVANLATENNIYYELNKKDSKASNDDKDYYVGVYIEKSGFNGSIGIEGGYTQDERVFAELRDSYNRYIENDISEIPDSAPGDETPQLPNYTCRVEISPKTKRVYQVIFRSR